MLLASGSGLWSAIRRSVRLAVRRYGGSKTGANSSSPNKAVFFLANVYVVYVVYVVSLLFVRGKKCGLGVTLRCFIFTRESKTIENYVHNVHYVHILNDCAMLKRNVVTVRR
jgi:hypothetical protein